MNLIERYGNLPIALEVAEKELLNMPQLEVDIIHTFAPGIYMRQAIMPAGAFIMGHKHKTHHLNLLLKGRLEVVNNDGSKTMLKAPTMCMGTPGRKAAFIHEETTWVNVHATEERDVEKLDELLLDMSDHWNGLQSMSSPRTDDIEDYWRVLSLIGMSAEQVRSLSETDDLIPFPYGNYKIKGGRSDIEGKGLFATAKILKGEMICMARIEGKRTPAGRYINHGKYPNVCMKPIGHDIAVYALRDICGTLGGKEGEELTVNYIHAIEANKAAV